jgi:hypothetical protein
MRAGRMYACQSKYPQQLILDEFSVWGSVSKTSATLGDEILLREHPRIRISLSLKEAIEKRVKVRLIRSGQLIKVFEGFLPIEIDYIDEYYRPGEKIYYRIDARGDGAVVSNPIFITFG